MLDDRAGAPHRFPRGPSSPMLTKSKAMRASLFLWPSLDRVLVILNVIVVLVVVAPLFVLLAASLWSAQLIRLPGSWTLAHYTSYLTSSTTYREFGTTVLIAVGSSLVALVIGGTLAWIIGRTDVPFRRVLMWLPAAPLLLTPLMRDTAWADLYSPTTGMVNSFLEHHLGLHSAPFNAYSIYGVILALGLFMYVLSYVLLLGPMTAMGSSLDEASRMTGAGRLHTAWHVNLPMLRPALISSLLLTGVLTTRAFETPIILGLPGNVHVFTSTIYNEIDNNDNFGAASSESVVYMVIIALLLVWYSRSTRKTSKYVLTDARGQGGARTKLGRWRYPIMLVIPVVTFISFVMPFAATAYESFLPYYTVTQAVPPMTTANYSGAWDFQGMSQAFRDSFIVAGSTAIVCVVLALAVTLLAYTTRYRWRRFGEVIATLPWAFPPLVISMALLLTFLSTPGINSLYQTPVITVLTLSVVYMPIALRTVGSAVIAIEPALLEASASCGARRSRTLASILMPLLAGPVVGALIVTFILSFGELGAIAIATPQGFPLVPYEVFTMWANGGPGQVAAANIIVMGVIIGVLILGRLLVSGITRIFRTAHTQPTSGESTQVNVPSLAMTR
jgi:iron(III) transport system permease protein